MNNEGVVVRERQDERWEFVGGSPLEADATSMQIVRVVNVGGNLRTGTSERNKALINSVTQAMVHSRVACLGAARP
jgi:hypothetical protein